MKLDPYCLGTISKVTELEKGFIYGIEEMCRDPLVGSLELWSLDCRETFIRHINKCLLFEKCCSGH